MGGYLAAMSRALVGAGHHVVIVTGKAAGYPEEELGPCGRVLRLYTRDEIGRRAVHERVLHIARAERMDWIEGADHLGEAAGLFPLADRPPVVIKAHSSNPLQVVWRSEIWYRWQFPLVRLAMLRQWRQHEAERRSFRDADALVAPSSRLRDEILRDGLADCVRVVPNPVTVCAEGREESSHPLLLMVGRISIGKGIGYVPGLMRAVLRRYPDAVLEIAGGDGYACGLGPLRRWLVKQLGADAHAVKFLGVLGAAELDAAYRRAWVHILPSRWDNFPNAVLDAMMREVPVVASPHGGMPEMLAGTDSPVEDPASAVFATAVIRLLGDAARRRALGKVLRTHALARYSPSVVVNQYIRTVSEALGKQTR